MRRCGVGGTIVPELPEVETVRRGLLPAMKDQLIASAQVRAVSYGEDSRRQLVPGEWGEDGAANRRVSLVVDYLGPVPGR